MRAANHQQYSYRLSEMATRLPWWGGILSALASYVLLHPIASVWVPASGGDRDPVMSALGRLLVLVAEVGQYLLPLAFLIAAAFSGIERWRRAEISRFISQDRTGSFMRSLRQTDFESLVADAFRHEDYQARILPSTSKPGETVIELSRDGRSYLVDYTDWRASSAGVAPLRHLRERISVRGAAGGFAVTSGVFSQEARQFASDVDIALIDGRRLKRMLHQEANWASDTWPFGFRLPGFASSLWRRPQPGIHPTTAGRRETVNPSTPPFSVGDIEDNPEPMLRSDSLGEVAHQDEETIAGRELGALILAERGGAAEAAIGFPPIQGKAAEQAQATAQRPPLPKPRARSVANALGMLLAAAALWSICAWFLTLPENPTDTPWALLGAGSDSDDAMMRRLQALKRSGSAPSALREQQPLGQYQFGPPQGFLSQAPAQEVSHQETMEQQEAPKVYHSLRELEAAFETKYVPPPECYAYESNNLMVKCGNHRIRARQAFIANGGKITPLVMGSWADPPEPRPQSNFGPEPGIEEEVGHTNGDWARDEQLITDTP